tara:strand:+ start:334 stop:516 length:183 start_codon:yes stop_codon:yes gene_type:complete
MTGTTRRGGGVYQSDADEGSVPDFLREILDRMLIIAKTRNMMVNSGLNNTLTSEMKISAK